VVIQNAFNQKEATEMSVTKHEKKICESLVNFSSEIHSDNYLFL